jgi:hypothetical protein
MEPKRRTSPALKDIQEELVAREPIFHRPEHGTTREAFLAMTAEDFWQVGASGRRYDREYVLDVLEQRFSTPHEEEWEAEGFYCQLVAPDNYLLTYTLRQAGRVSRRATLWRRAAHGWVIAYHQGTLVQPE